MGPIDNAGAATQVIPTTSNRLETPTQAVSETERPIEEADQTATTQNPAISQGTEEATGPGQIVDTFV